MPYPGTGRLVPFLEGVRERWPGARVVVLLPFPRSQGARRQHEMQARVREDVRAAALAAGVDVLDVADDLGRDRCANGYNLGQESSDRVGRRLAEEVLRQPAPA